MPIYEYVCGKCKSKFELMRPFSKSSEPADCPSCKAKAERVLSRFACFTAGESGDIAPISGGGGGCAGCSSSSCATCNN
jgi:putative FmdB family regulatory protein